MEKDGGIVFEISKANREDVPVILDFIRRPAALAAEKNYGRLEWAVLDWNEPSIEFYKSLGARLMDEWIVNRFTGDKLHKLAAM